MLEGVQGHISTVANLKDWMVTEGWWGLADWMEKLHNSYLFSYQAMEHSVDDA